MCHDHFTVTPSMELLAPPESQSPLAQLDHAKPFLIIPLLLFFKMFLFDSLCILIPKGLGSMVPAGPL